MFPIFSVTERIIFFDPFARVTCLIYSFNNMYGLSYGIATRDVYLAAGSPLWSQLMAGGAGERDLYVIHVARTFAC